MRLYIIAACGMVHPLIGTPIPLNCVDVTGTLNQFDTSVPFTSEYQVLPRVLADIQPSIATSVQRGSWGRLKTVYR